MPIALDEKNDWLRYSRAIMYLVIGQTDACKRDLQHAIELVQGALDNSPGDWRIRFNLALYKLINNDADAEVQYNQLISSCLLMPYLQDAIDDLDDLIMLQLYDEPAQHLRSELSIWIAKLSGLPAIS